MVAYNLKLNCENLNEIKDGSPAVYRKQFTANNSPQGRFTAGQFTAETIHRRAIHRRGISPQGHSPQGNSIELLYF
jgi:hypothetical protein